MSLYNELKRRNVFRVAIAYLALAWLLIEVAGTLFPAFGIPAWAFRFVVIVLALGFIPTLVFSWAYEITPEGLMREKDVVRDVSISRHTAKRLDGITIGLIVVALAFILADRFWLGPRLAEQSVVPAEVVTADVRTSEPEPIEPQYLPNSIAVLPFVNMSDDAANEYFADGISEELLNLLTQLPKLRVIARTSSFSYKGKDVQIAEIAESLNVAHVLEGSVRKSGNQVRITAQLTRASDSSHMWSETYDRTLDNIFAIQDEIAAAVVDALKITLLGEELKATETNPEAYALYLQGLHLDNQRIEESRKQAATLLKQALEIDPGFAPAWTALGDLYERQTGMGDRSFYEGADLARETIQKALAIDPKSGRAYAVLAEIEMFYDWDFTAALQHMQQALAFSPGDVFILTRAARQHSLLGRVDEAIDLHRQSIALDPVRDLGHFFMGRALLYAQRLEEAADSLQMALFLSPDYDPVRYFLVLVRLAQGDAPAALMEIEQMETGGTDEFYQLIGTALVHNALGDVGVSDAALDELIEKFRATSAYQIAEVYAFRGEIDNAFYWLDQAYTIRDPGMVQMLLDPLLVNLHTDPRWELFLDKMGLLH